MYFILYIFNLFFFSYPLLDYCQQNNYLLTKSFNLSDKKEKLYHFKFCKPYKNNSLSVSWKYVVYKMGALLINIYDPKHSTLWHQNTPLYFKNTKIFSATANVFEVCMGCVTMFKKTDVLVVALGKNMIQNRGGGIKISELINTPGTG